MKLSSINKITCAAATLTLLLPVAAVAQQMGGPGMFGQAPPPMFGGPGPQQGPRPPRPDDLTPVGLSIATLSSALKLSDTQREKIAAIQARVETARRALMPGGGMGGPGGQGFGGPNGMGRPMDQGRPGMPGIGAGPQNGGELDDINADASDRINALLSGDQQSALTKLIHTLRDMRSVGIPPSAYAQLNLDDSQIVKIAKLASDHRASVYKALDSNTDPRELGSMLQDLQKKVCQDALGVLNDDQAAIVRSQRHDGPQMAGSPGGFASPQGGPQGFGGGWGGPQGMPGPGMPPPGGPMGASGPGFQSGPQDRSLPQGSSTLGFVPDQDGPAWGQAGAGIPTPPAP